MSYLLRASREYGVWIALISLLIGVLALTSPDWPTGLGALKAPAVGAAFFMALVGLVLTAFPPSIVRADLSGVTLYSTILPNRSVEFLPWREITSFEITTRIYGDQQGIRHESKILMIRTETPGRRVKCCTNLSRSVLRRAMPDVDPGDPRAIAWFLPTLAPPEIVVEKLKVVQAASQRLRPRS